MANKQIPDWKKVAAVCLSQRKGYRSVADDLEINWKTVKKYKKQAQENGGLEMEGINMEMIA